MSKLLLFIKNIRLINLLFLALVQCLVAYYFVKEFMVFQLLLLISATLLIASSGYFFNDIADIEIDIQNNKTKAVNYTNKSYFIKVSSSLMLLGLIIALVLCLYSNSFYFLYFILASICLLVYAFFLSKFKIIGNFLISLLIGLAIILAYYVLSEGSEYQMKYTYKTEWFVWIYAALAFVFNWFREVIKDLEDLNGDTQFGRTSLGSLFGARKTSFMIGLCLILFSMFFMVEFLILKNMFLLVLSSATLIAGARTIIAKNTKDYTQGSLLIKIVLFLGLISPIIFM